jgi:putative addiction module component (TIGR02574 family)
MNPYPEFEALFKLPVAVRLQLVEDLWDSIAAERADVPLAQAQLDELAIRATRYDAGEETLHTLDEAVAEARRKACGA